MANETVAIWQVQSGAANGTEVTAGASNTILANDDTHVPSTGAFTAKVDVEFRRAVPENEAVDADNNEIQDMGIGGLDVTIIGVIGDADNDAAANSVNKLSKWIQDGNTTTGFTKGRYGLRLDRLPQFNVVPTSTLGFHLRDVSYTLQGEKKDMVDIVIRLALGGDIATAI